MRRRAFSSGIRRLARCPTAVVLVCLIASCAVSATPSAMTSGSPSLPAASETAPLAPSPTAFTPPMSLAAGEWTSINWTKVEGQAYVWAPPPDSSDLNVIDLGWRVFGWSRGYVAFDTITTTRDDASWTSVTNTSNSIDGLKWELGGDFKLTGGPHNPAPDNGVVGMVEGPAGLLVDSGFSVPCSSPGRYEWPLAISPDGTRWQTVNPGTLGSNQVLDAGASGYITAGAGGVFISTDGKSWAAADLKGKATEGLDGIESGAAFAGGFVITGETYGTLGPATGGCDSGRRLLSPSLWWSPDGKTWTHEEVPSGAAGTGVVMDVCRLGDRVLVASETTETNSTLTWASANGRTWKRMPASDKVTCSPDDHSILASGARNIILSTERRGIVDLITVRDDLTMVALTKTGDVPPWDELRNFAVLGPAGLIVTDTSGNTYFGVPVAG